MEFSYHIFLLALLIPLVSCADPLYERCSQNFTNNNISKNNINKVIYELISNTPSNGYATSTIFTSGSNNSTVYGLSRCRGDIGTQTCSDCIVAAAQKLLAICPNTAASQIWYDFCSIRYDTSNFLGKLDVSVVIFEGSTKEEALSQEFDSAVWKLLNGVKVNTALDSNNFGMGEINTIKKNTTIYGMAQCTQDLQGLTCMQCLESITNGMRNYCRNHTGCVVMSSSCFMKYEISNFLFAKTIPVYPGDAASAPAGNAASAPVPSTL